MKRGEKVRFLLRGQVLEGGEGGVAGGGRRHALHLARGVGGGAHAAQAAVQQVRRVAEGERERETGVKLGFTNWGPRSIPSKLKTN